MQLLTDQAWQKVIDLSNRYGVSTDAVMAMLQSVANGGGTMAQFYINELGGGGQWMLGGMTMVGDMFNHGLKAKVDGLCLELSQLLQTQPFVPTPPPPQTTWQNGGQQQQQGGMGSGGASLYIQNSGYGGSWWPSELGSPNGSGGQNNVRYAYFSNAHRLAVDINGAVTVYDTLDHQIGGVSQQQSGDGSLTFTSQYGTVNVSSLPVVSGNGYGNAAPAYSPPPQSNYPTQQYAPQPSYQSNSGSSQETDIFAKIERLADLNSKGIISREEFDAKKAELLSRL